MSKADWVWMPHPAHFIGGNQCKFRMATKVGNVVVSTVGEYVPDARAREVLVMFGASRGVKEEFEQIGFDRLYETMVFKAVKRTGEGSECCPWECDASEELDFLGYNTAGDACNGHMDMCEKWDAIALSEQLKSLKD